MDKSMTNKVQRVRGMLSHLWRMHWLAAGVGLVLLLMVTVPAARAACGAGNLSNLCSASYGLVGNPKCRTGFRPQPAGFGQSHSRACYELRGCY